MGKLSEEAEAEFEKFLNDNSIFEGVELIRAAFVEGYEAGRADEAAARSLESLEER